MASESKCLTNDFFVSLLDMEREWNPTADATGVFAGRPRDGRAQMDRHRRRPRLRL
jgi:catalase (peroxidase I)